MKKYSVHSVKVEDAEKILNIYAPYILETAITFEYDVPTVTEFRARIEKTLAKYPYLAAKDGDKIVGYAYAGEFVGRAAYSRSAALSMYVDKNLRRGGIGKTLYAALENALRERGILNLYSCIAYPKIEDEYLTRNSVEFHKHIGFEIVGRFHDCAYKFNRWYDMIWMEKIIGEHTTD